MFIDCAKTSSNELYKALLGCVVPRPIAWVSSQSAERTLNLAPFSFFNAFSADPPIIGIGIGKRRKVSPDGVSAVVEKDTTANILAVQEFVVNVVSQHLAEKMNISSAEYSPAVDEFEKSGLTPSPSSLVKPPRVSESMISMECKLFQHIDLGKSNLILGEVVCIHIKDEICTNGSINVEQLQPIGRLSGSSYCRVDSLFEMPRPVVSDEERYY